MRIFLLTAIAMIAFAGNSLLCRVALDTYAMDPATFTSIRLISGALILWILTFSQKKNVESNSKGNWQSALALFTYATCFSYAYVNLTTAMGALLLFGAVQATMISYGIAKGERLTTQQNLGLVTAITGFAYLLWPGLTTPPLFSSMIMIIAGIAWGVYSLLGKGANNPIVITTGNFLRCIPLAIILVLINFTVSQHTTSELSNISISAVIVAITSGAVTSGMGYALWYRVLPSLKSTTASTVQLSVPVIASFAGILLLSESMSERLLFSSLAILGGISLVITKKQNEINSLTSSNKT